MTLLCVKQTTGKTKMPVPASVRDRQETVAACLLFGLCLFGGFVVLELESGTCRMLTTRCAEAHTHPRSLSQVQLFGNLDSPREWTLLGASVTSSLPIPLTMSITNNTAVSWIHRVLTAQLSDRDMSYQWTEEGYLFLAFRALSCRNRSNDVFKNSW